MRGGPRWFSGAAGGAGSAGGSGVEGRMGFTGTAALSPGSFTIPCPPNKCWKTDTAASIHSPPGQLTSGWKTVGTEFQENSAESGCFGGFAGPASRLSAGKAGRGGGRLFSGAAGGSGGRGSDGFHRHGGRREQRLLPWDTIRV